MVIRNCYVLILCFVLGLNVTVLGRECKQECGQVRVGDIVYQTNFDGAEDLAGWSGSGRLDTGFTMARSLMIHRLAGSENKEMLVSQFTIPCQKFQGCWLTVSAMVKGECITTGPHSVKFLAAVYSPTEGANYKSGIAGGTFGWKQTSVRVFVPADATKMTLFLGLDAKVNGRVWFDDLKVIIRREPVKKALYKEVTDPRMKLPVLRGTMIVPSNMDDESLQVLGTEWKADLVRWQLICMVKLPPTQQWNDYEKAYDAWLEGELRLLDETIPLLKKHGLYVVLDLHTPPGGGTGWNGNGLFSEQQCQKKLVEVWKMLAKRYKDNKLIWGYDLVNEPIDVLGVSNVGYDCVPGDLYNWWELAQKTSEEIRKIDPYTPIIFEPSPGGVPYGWRGLQPLNVTNVIYSLHMYMPYQFTHQLVLPCFSKKLRYPGFKFEGEVWDQSRVARELKIVSDFQKKYGVRVYVGEFSAVRWAEDHSAYRYMKDILDIFEANNWDWTYHAFRENPCWSVELDENKDNPKAMVTDRQKMLRECFSKNEKPTW